MSEEHFQKLTEEQENREEKPFKNPRNAAAGSLRQKDPAIAAQRNLDIFVFNIQQIEGKDLTGHKESLDFLQRLGFPVSPSYQTFSSIEAVMQEIQPDRREFGKTTRLVLTGQLLRWIAFAKKAAGKYSQISQMGDCLQISAGTKADHTAGYSNQSRPYRRVDADSGI